MQRGHGGERVACKRIVEARPAVLPELLAVVEHHPAQARLRAARLVAETAVLGRVPRGRRRHEPVAEHADIERRVDERRRARELLVVAGEDVRDGPVRHREPDPVRPDEQLLGRAQVRRVRKAPLQALARQLAEADRPGPRPPGSGCCTRASSASRIVVGHLVHRDVRPHLQHAHGEVPRLGPRNGDAERDRRRPRRSGDRGPREASPAGARPGRRLRRRRAPTPRYAGLSTGAQRREYRLRDGRQRIADRRHGRRRVHRARGVQAPGGRRLRGRGTRAEPRRTRAGRGGGSAVRPGRHDAAGGPRRCARGRGRRRAHGGAAR